jgi:uncharacterized protein with GYD domain
MPGYIILHKLTQQGATIAKSLPERIKHATEDAKKLGARVIGTWVTMGEYDMVAVVEAPDDATMALIALKVGMEGNVTTQTLRAFSEEEFAKIAAKLP